MYLDNSRTGIISMVISWEIGRGRGAPFAFFVLGGHLGHRLALRTFFLSAGTCAQVGGEKKTRKGKEKANKTKQSKKRKNKTREGRVSENSPNRLRLVRKIEPSSGL